MYYTGRRTRLRGPQLFHCAKSIDCKTTSLSLFLEKKEVLGVLILSI